MRSQLGIKGKAAKLTRNRCPVAAKAIHTRMQDDIEHKTPPQMPNADRRLRVYRRVTDTKMGPFTGV